MPIYSLAWEIERDGLRGDSGVFLLMAPINYDIISGVFCGDFYLAMGVRYDQQIWLDWDTRNLETDLRKNSAHSVAR